MNNPFDFFDAIYCVNLDERTDRWHHAQVELDQLQIRDRVERSSAMIRQAIKDFDYHQMTSL